MVLAGSSSGILQEFSSPILLTIFTPPGIICIKWALSSVESNSRCASHYCICITVRRNQLNNTDRLLQRRLLMPVVKILLGDPGS